ncbi:hypothetical protein RI367_008351 [Sorochytrium milnesiophthora]
MQRVSGGLAVNVAPTPDLLPSAQKNHSSPFLPTSGFGQQLNQFNANVCAKHNHTDRTKPGVVATFLTSDQYLVGAQVLGYSLQLVNTTAPMLLFYLKGTLSESSLCKVRAVGWTPRIIEKLPNPQGQQPPEQYKDQFTKLRMWELEEYANILLIDSDAYVRQPVDQIFCLDVPFARANNFIPDFNNGVSYLRPHKATFAALKKAMQETGSYNVGLAEQALLDVFWKSRQHVVLPYSWNVDLNTFLRQGSWPQLWDDRIIVHFTRDKPWTIRGRKPQSHDRRPWDEWYALERRFMSNPHVNGAQCESSRPR